MAAIPKPTGLEHLLGEGLTLKNQIPPEKMLGANDPLSSNVIDRQEQPFTIWDSILSGYMSEGPGPSWTPSSIEAWQERRPNYQVEPESNPLLDQLLNAARGGDLERDADIFSAAKARSPYWPKK